MFTIKLDTPYLTYKLMSLHTRIYTCVVMMCIIHALNRKRKGAALTPNTIKAIQQLYINLVI